MRCARCNVNRHLSSRHAVELPEPEVAFGLGPEVFDAVDVGVLVGEELGATSQIAQSYGLRLALTPCWLVLHTAASIGKVRVSHAQRFRLAQRRSRISF